jgi:hypothetical protein
MIADRSIFANILMGVEGRFIIVGDETFSLYSKLWSNVRINGF